MSAPGTPRITAVLAALIVAALAAVSAFGVEETPPQAVAQDLPAALADRSIQPGASPAPAVEPGAAAGAGQLTAREYFALGEESYETGDFARAGEYYSKCLALGPDPARQAKAHERLAFIYAAFGEEDKVYSEFVLSLEIDRSLTLDPEQVSPKIYEAFARAREDVVREGTLVVNTDPAGADVLLSGEYLGEAPVRKERLAEGDYVLRLIKPGYESSEAPLSIKKDVTLTIDEKMVRARGTLSVTTVPPGAQAVMDGRAVGATPLDIEYVSGGRHTISFKNEYFEPLEADVVMEKGETRVFTAELKRRLLVIADDGGNAAAMHAVQEALSAMGTVSIVNASPPELESRLIERGLDPSSIGFILEHKQVLTLEDSASLSGVMEEDRVELALAMKLHRKDGGYELNGALYSTASMFGDGFSIHGKDEAGLAEAFGRVIGMWKAVHETGRATAGLRLVDRADGGVEVISATPGMPGAAAGLMPGDVIRSVDTVAVGAKSDFTKLTTSGEHDISYTRRDSTKSARLAASMSAVEAPPDSNEYLYNLALVEFRRYLDSIPAPAEGANDDRRGLAALNLGNVYVRMGEYEKAVKAYSEALMSAKFGVCTGTALYRSGQAYEKMEMWSEAAGSYRRAMLLYPDAMLGSAEGEPAAPLALARLKWLYETGLTKERWWQ